MDKSMVKGRTWKQLLRVRFSMIKLSIVIMILCLCILGPRQNVFATTQLEVNTTKQTGNKVKVAWNKVQGVSNYHIYVSVGDNKSYKLQAEVATESQQTTEEQQTIEPQQATEIQQSDEVLVQEEATILKYYCSEISSEKTYYFKVVALDVNGDVLDTDTTNLFNGNIVSTTKQKYSYTDMQKDIKQLQNKYSDYVHVDIIGTTADKRNIYDVILGNPNAEQCVVFQASIHAREYMTSQLVMEQMEYYLDNYNKKYDGKTYKKIFDDVCVHVVAMSNPDGVTISQKGFGGIRSKTLRKKLKKMRGARNTTIWKANARGVDLNRQFDYRFKYVKKWKKGAYALYGGKKPVSENETKALVQLVNEVNPKAVVNYHAMGNVIYCKYGGPKKVQKKVYKLAGEIRSLTGYSYMGLDRSPGFANWLVCKKGIPSCTVEIGMYSTPVPISQWNTVWKQNKNVMAATAKLYN